ncbi:MAG: MATE family efflux transporter, partial [Flavobacteriaceae bacterium]|nr:MATE family efflux transporter [Flavobacteriaceae bacterium]
LGITLFLLILLAKPLMSLMDQPEEVVLLARPYLDIVAFSLIPLISFQAFKQFSDGLSMTRFPMYATIFANIINIILNYVLIFGKFGFPELGIVGAGIGTLVARVLMLFLLWYFLSRHHKSRAYVRELKLLKLERRMIRKINHLGLPSAMQMFFEVAIFTAAIWLSGLLGKNAQAANQIALNLSSMTFMVAMGLGVAAMVRVGNQKGLRAFSELRRIAFSIFLLGLGFACVFALLFYIFHNDLPTIYVDMDNPIDLKDTSEVVSIASKLLLAAAIFQLSDSLQVMVLGALRGMQDVKIPTLITFVSYWVIGFPICYVLGKEDALGSFGIWIGLIVGLTAAGILLYLRFDYLTNRLISQKSND